MSCRHHGNCNCSSREVLHEHDRGWKSTSSSNAGLCMIMMVSLVSCLVILPLMSVVYWL